MLKISYILYWSWTLLKLVQVPLQPISVLTFAGVLPQENLKHRVFLCVLCAGTAQPHKKNEDKQLDTM